MSTVGQILLGNDPARAQDQMRHELARSEVLDSTATVAGIGSAELCIQVAQALAELLSIPVEDLLFSAWAKQREVQRACERTRGNPDDHEVVVLASHTLKSTQKPKVILDVNGVSRPLLELELAICLNLDSVTLTIGNGSIIAISLGRVSSAEVKLVAGSFVLRRALPQVTIPKIIDLSRTRPVEEPTRAAPVNE